MEEKDESLPAAPADREDVRLANQLRLLTRIHPLMEHNLRGLINGLSLNVSLLELALPAAERGDSVARSQVRAAVGALRQEIDRSTAKLAAMVKSTAPQLEGEPELLDLRTLLGEVAELLSLEVRRVGSRLSLELPAEAALWEGRRDRLRQVLLNLAVGLLEAMPRKETLSVALAVRGGRAEVAMAAPLATDGGYSADPPLSDLNLARSLCGELGGEISADETAASPRRWSLSLPLSSP